MPWMQKLSTKTILNFLFILFYFSDTFGERNSFIENSH